MDFKKFLTAGFAGGIVIAVVSFVFDGIVQVIWPYEVMSLGGMRAPDDPVMLLFFLHYWVISFALAYVYGQIKVFFPGDRAMEGARFGFIMWVAASVPSAFIVLTSMAYPVGFHVNSVVGSLLYMLAAGVTIVRLME